MEENFEDLLEKYLDNEEIEKKKKIIETEKEEKKSTNYLDLAPYDDYSINITDFLRDYLKMNVNNIRTKNLTHRNLKDLTQDNPLVQGIFNNYVDLDEIVKKYYLIVKDCYGNYGSYINPDLLRDISHMYILGNNIKKLSDYRITDLTQLDVFYEMYIQCQKYIDEYNYLKRKWPNYDAILKKVHRIKIISSLKKFVELYGASQIGIENEKIEEVEYDKYKRK